MTKTKWIIRIPALAKVLVKVGEKVNEGQAVAILNGGVVKRFDFSVVFSRFSAEVLEKLKRELTGKSVTEGEQMVVGGKKIYAPATGNLIEIDEFYNLVIEEKDQKEKTEIQSPVGAKVLSVAQGKVVLWFNAMVVEGKGLVEGKAWGHLGNEVVGKLNDLNYTMKDKVMLVEKIDRTMLMKAEVMGVVGMVIKKQTNDFDFDRMDTMFPILEVGPKEWTQLKDKLSDYAQSKVFVNTVKGRLLVVNK